MQERKVRVGVVFFNYGSNGGLRAEVPDIRQWAVKTAIIAKSDPRIEEVLTQDFSDTPITMTRNAAVQWAKQNSVDVLVMVDSDQSPDMYVGIDPEATPFFESAFDFLYTKWDEGPHVVASPYCGPPPSVVNGGLSLVYVFRWEERGSPETNVDMSLQAYTRNEATMMTGIQPCAALPTGLIMYDMRAFDLIPEPYFYYEFDGAKNGIRGPESAKASTEDVTNTRDISLAGWEKLGRDVVYCCWSSWAGHWKPYLVGKPVSIKADHVAKSLRDAVLSGVKTNQRLIHLTRPKNLPLPANGVTKVVLDYPNVQQVATPVGAGPAQTEIVANAIFSAQDLSDLDGQVSTSKRDLLTLGFHAGHESFCKRDQPFLMVEVGSWAGRSAIALAEGAEDHPNWQLHCIDHFNGTGTDYTRTLKKRLEYVHGPDVLYKAFKQRTEKYGEHIQAHRMSSLTSARDYDVAPHPDALYGNRKIDLLFLDAGHTYEELKADLDAWMPHVAVGGLIMGHDYSESFPGVKQAVQEAFGGCSVVGDVWFVRRGDPAETDEETTLFDIAARDRVQITQPRTLSGIIPSTNGACCGG